jgi:hypothetical protein
VPYRWFHAKGNQVTLRDIDPLEIVKMFKTITGRQEFSKLKGLLFSVHSPEDLEGDVLGMIHRTLQEMGEGEIKTLRFPKNPEISDFTD